MRVEAADLFTENIATIDRAMHLGRFSGPGQPLAGDELLSKALARARLAALELHDALTAAKDHAARREVAFVYKEQGTDAAVATRPGDIH